MAQTEDTGPNRTSVHRSQRSLVSSQHPFVAADEGKEQVWGTTQLNSLYVQSPVKEN